MIKVFRNAVIRIVVHASSLIAHIAYVCSKVVASKQTSTSVPRSCSRGHHKQNL